MAEPTDPVAAINPPAIASQAASPASGQPAQSAPVASDVASLTAQLDALLKHKSALEGDLKKYRDAKNENEVRATADRADAEKKAREAGDFAKLHDAEREKRVSLEARLAEISPMADRHSAHEKRVVAKLDAAKAKGDLPAFVVRSIDIAAAEVVLILRHFRVNRLGAIEKRDLFGRGEVFPVTLLHKQRQRFPQRVGVCKFQRIIPCFCRARGMVNGGANQGVS